LKIRAIAYWATTMMLVFGVLSGGVAELVCWRGNVEDIVHLGYPVYFVTIIGFWKALGSIALLAPSFPRLKEWAIANSGAGTDPEQEVPWPTPSAKGCS
jgi:uncharacterized membrane protein YphA (DoxX/SURF4 family)